MSYLFGLFLGILVFVISVLCREWSRERLPTVNGYTFPLVPVALAILIGIALKQTLPVVLGFSISATLSFVVIDRSLLIRNQVKGDETR